jgi:hypothetical protein
MKNRSSVTTRRILLSALFATVFTLGASTSVSAAGISDSDLRGFKGGLVEIGLKDASVVRGVLYRYTSEHVELEVAGDRTVKLHRSWVASLRAAPAGSTKTAFGAIPRGAGLPYSAAPERIPERPAVRASAPPRTTPDPTSGPAETPVAGAPVAGPPVSGPPVSGSTSGPISKGLVFQLKMGGNLLSIMGGSIAAWLNGSFMFGYKMGNLTIGLGLEMTYNDDNLPNMEPEPLKTSNTMVLFQPTLEYYLAQKSQLVLYLSAGLHVGFLKNHSDPGEDITDPMLGFHAGLGMRLFFHPRFAVGVESGLRGVWLLIENVEDLDQDDNHMGTLAIYGSATLTAIW